jgi:hypothetical protein
LELLLGTGIWKWALLATREPNRNKLSTNTRDEQVSLLIAKLKRFFTYFAKQDAQASLQGRRRQSDKSIQRVLLLGIIEVLLLFLDLHY